MRIWLGTWNGKQSFSTQRQINDWFNRGNDFDADVVALGLQEARRKTPELVAENFILLKSTNRRENKNNGKYPNFID